MRSYLFAAVAAVGVMVGLAGAGGAADKPAKAKPDGVKSYDEATKAFPAGEKMTVTRVRNIPQTVTKQVQVGDKVQFVTETVLVPVQEAVVVVIPERKWTLGVEGWHDKDGFNVEKLAADSPLAKVTVKAGAKGATEAVAAGDTITRIDGKPVATEFDLFLALQTAAKPDAVPVEFVRGKDGTVVTGTVAARKAK